LKNKTPSKSLDQKAKRH